ncbi:hypothetical protein F4860DRAFT_516604 [Xylaria cubensis]|nr:hypothetical protein F4860DRAFT_516604 [Xylaria cubensis]
MLTASDFLPLPKLEGFMLPAQIPLLLSSLLSMRDHPDIKVERKSENSVAASIYQLLIIAFIYHSDWIDPLNLTLNMPFWTHISEESGIERTTARRLLMGLLDARREYNELRPDEPYKDDLGYYADLLCKHQEKLFKEHDLIYRPVTTIPQAANLKREPESDADRPVIKRRRYSETYSIASRPSKTHSAEPRSVEPRSPVSRSAEYRPAEPRSVRKCSQSRSEPQSPQSTDFSQPSADLLRRIQEAGNMKAVIAEMENRLPGILNDTEEYEQATAALEVFKKILENNLQHIRDEHREFLNQAGPFDDGEESSVSPQVKIEPTSDDEVVMAGTQLVIPSIESPDRNISQGSDADDENSPTPTTKSGETHNETVLTGTGLVIPSIESPDRDISQGFHKYEISLTPTTKSGESQNEVVMAETEEAIRSKESPDRDTSLDFYNAFREAQRDYLDQAGPLGNGEESSVSPIVKIEPESDDEAALTGIKEVIQSAETPGRDNSQSSSSDWEISPRSLISDTWPGSGDARSEEEDEIKRV